jgi:phenylacetate-CoA ligase
MTRVTIHFLRLLRQARLDREVAYRRKMRAIRRFVEEAIETSPFHRERWRRAGLTARDLQGPDALSALPLMERADVATQLDEIASTAVAPARRRELRTSGSSGMPLRVWVGDHEQSVRQALQLRARWLAGRRPLLREAIIGSHQGTPRRSRPPAFRRSLYLSALDAPADIAAALRAFAPDYVVAFPSTLLELGENAGVRPALITTGAEVLEPEVRGLLERRFGAPVRDIYGAIETGLLAFECASGKGYHLNDDEIHFEWLPAERPADGLHELVVTPLFARATPLVRYRLGDLVRRLPGRCPCGSWLPRIAAIEGRRDDWLVRPDGRRVPPAAIRALFRCGEPLVQYRVTQDADGELHLELAGPFRSGNGVPALVSPLADLLARRVHVQVRSYLPPDPSGKRRAIRRLAGEAAVAT